ncbi:hypothetical protein [Amycolatopsis camponoti]|uniref:hypothetical protein n=1 Tax=Amycolatopsis camponoti TaxID=2606593 RepID=UPI001E64EEF4|nr:hypothetical protein [Amycolatopsis camponoti]
MVLERHEIPDRRRARYRWQQLRVTGGDDLERVVSDFAGGFRQALGGPDEFDQLPIAAEAVERSALEQGCVLLAVRR